MDATEFQKMLMDDPALAQNLKEALERNAGAEEISGILAGAGMDAATSEAVLAEYQLMRGAAIGTQELDDGELDHVAGGYDCNPNASDCNYITACDLHYSCPWDL